MYTRPLGLASPDSFAVRFDGIEAASFTSVQHWSFFLDPQLRLNMTFHHIYFSSVNINPCHFASLTVFDCECHHQRLRSGGCAGSGLIFKGHEEKYQFWFRFCGMHSKTIIHTRCTGVVIKAHLQSYVLHDTQLFFSVMDANKSFSVPTHNYIPQRNSHLLGDFLLHVIKLVPAHITVEVYRLVSSKLHVIILTLKVQTLAPDMFDGPGSKSRSLGSRSLRSVGSQNNKTASYMTSSFQCVLYFYNRTVVNYSTKLNTGIQHITINLQPSEILVISSDWFCGINRFCSMRILTKANDKINVSATLEYEGNHNTEDCMFGGLVAFKKDQSTDIKTICPKPCHILETKMLKNDLQFHQSIHSNDPEMLVLLYSYEQYAQINTSLTISSTTCTRKYLNICQKESKNTLFFNVYTYLSKVHRVLVNSSECLILQLSYNLEEDTDSLDHFGEHKGHVFPIIRRAEMQKGSGISWPVEKCKTDVIPEMDSLDVTGKLQIKVLGFFRGNLLSFSPQKQEKLSEMK